MRPKYVKLRSANQTAEPDCYMNASAQLHDAVLTPSSGSNRSTQNELVVAASLKAANLNAPATCSISAAHTINVQQPQKRKRDHAGHVCGSTHHVTSHQGSDVSVAVVSSDDQSCV